MGVLLDSIVQAEGVLAIIGFILLFLRQSERATRFLHLGSAAVRWFALILILVFVVVALARANYAKYNDAHQRLTKLEALFSDLSIDVQPAELPEVGKFIHVTRGGSWLEIETAFRIHNTSAVPIVLQFMQTEKPKGTPFKQTIRPTFFALGVGHADIVRTIFHVDTSKLKESVDEFADGFETGTFRIELDYNIQFYAKGDEDCMTYTQYVNYWAWGNRMELRDRWPSGPVKPDICIQRIRAGRSGD